MGQGASKSVTLKQNDSKCLEEQQEKNGVCLSAKDAQVSAQVARDNNSRDRNSSISSSATSSTARCSSASANSLTINQACERASMQEAQMEKLERPIERQEAKMFTRFSLKAHDLHSNNLIGDLYELSEREDESLSEQDEQQPQHWRPAGARGRHLLLRAAQRRPQTSRAAACKLQELEQRHQLAGVANQRATRRTRAQPPVVGWPALERCSEPPVCSAQWATRAPSAQATRTRDRAAQVAKASATIDLAAVVRGELLASSNSNKSSLATATSAETNGSATQQQAAKRTPDSCQKRQRAPQKPCNGAKPRLAASAVELATAAAAAAAAQQSAREEDAACNNDNNNNNKNVAQHNNHQQNQGEISDLAKHNSRAKLSALELSKLVAANSANSAEEFCVESIGLVTTNDEHRRQRDRHKAANCSNEAAALVTQSGHIKSTELDVRTNESEHKQQRHDRQKDAKRKKKLLTTRQKGQNNCNLLAKNKQADQLESSNFLLWDDIELRYGKMSRQYQHQRNRLVTNCASGSGSQLLSANLVHQDTNCVLNKHQQTFEDKLSNSISLGATFTLPPAPPNYESRKSSSGNNGWSRKRKLTPFGSSCFCHLICASLSVLFPLFTSFKGYSLPGDLLADINAGFTIAVLHIPQGMAYGLLAGVEPIYGLYVSFVPVLIMSLMSRSRHVSYGTFAVISMLLMNSIDSVRHNLRNEFQRAPPADTIRAWSDGQQAQQQTIVLMDNHQARALDTKSQIKSFTEAADRPDQVVGFTVATEDELISEPSSPGTLPGGATQNGSLELELASSQAVFQIPSNIEILTCVCIICGVIHITMSLLRLGVLSLMFSDQLVSSFTTASAIHVTTSQLPGLVDLSLAPVQRELFKIVVIWWQFLDKVPSLLHLNSLEAPSNGGGDDDNGISPDDGPNRATALLSVLSIAFLLLIKELVEPSFRRRYKSFTCLPSELLLMAAVIFCSWYWQFNETFNIKIVGHVPTDLPAPKVPRLDLVPYVLKDAITIALISFAMNLSLAQVYAKEFKYKLDANQELLALGTANLVGSFFSCFPCASSLSRSSVQSSLKVRSQLCSLFSSSIVLVIICYAAPILHHLPRSTLSCIIVVALKGILTQLRDFYSNWKLSKLDALVWLVTFVSVIVLGVTYGLFVGIVASLFMVFFRLLTPNHSILGRLPGTEIYVDICAFSQCKQLERTRIFRFNSALCYLNRTMLRSRVEKCLPSIYKPQGFNAICARFHSRHSSASSLSFDPYNHHSSGDISKTSGAQSPPIEFLVIDCSAFAYCDCSGVATLVELIDDLVEHQVHVYLAACPLKMIDILERMGRSKVIKENCFPTITDAIGQIEHIERQREPSMHNFD